MKTFLTVLTIFSVFCLAAPLAFADESRYQTDEDQPVYGELVFASSPLKTMTEIPFRVNFGNDPDNAPVIHSAVCSLTMPAMPMPDNHPDLVCEGSSCTGTAVFTMAGAWRATFGLIMKNGDHTSVDFNIKMVNMK